MPVFYFPFPPSHEVCPQFLDPGFLRTFRFVIKFMLQVERLDRLVAAWHDVDLVGLHWFADVFDVSLGLLQESKSVSGGFLNFDAWHIKINN